MTVELARTFARAAEALRPGAVPGGASQREHPSTLQDLLQLHGESSTAVILLIMAAACVMPVGGVGTLLSVAMVGLAWRWARMLDTCNLPERLGRVRLSERVAYRALCGFSWVYRTADRLLRPRWTALVHDATRPWWACWIVLMAGLIFLPIPLGNVLPSLSLVMLSLGFMFRDGLLLVLSKLVGLGAVGFAVAFGHLLVDGFHRALAWAQTYWPM
ncbi:MAG: exopolysaccharide biosynthesis protein [Hydrogenophaga sp.]